MLKNQKRLLKLNLELAEMNAIIVEKLTRFADENNIDFPERESLRHLFLRIASIINEIREPYSKSPIPDEFIQRYKTDEDYPECKLAILINS